MTRVALRGIRSHLGRFLLSILAVLLGVAFVAGTFSLRTMMSSTFNDIVDSGVAGDVYVRGLEVAEGAGGPDGFATLGRIPLTIAEDVERVDGVAAVVPEVTGPIVLVGADGTAVMTSGPPSFGLGLHDDDPTAEVVDGREPTGAGEVALESSTLETSGLAVGDTTSVVLGGEVLPVEVVGEVGFGAPVAGATIVFLDMATATAVYAPDGAVTSIGAYAEDGATQEALRDRVADAVAGLPGLDDAEVVTGEDVRADSREQIESALGFISTFLLVFAGIALFVGAFIIANTFQMTVRQRQREFAMLRAIGASPTQVFVSILVQAVVVGVLGSALGVAAGVGLVSVLRQVFGRFGMEMSGSIPLDGFTVLVSIVTGTVVSVVAAAVPARRAALTPPVEAMRDDVATHDRASRVRAAVGAVLLAGGLAAVVAATAGTVDDRGTVLGVGAAAVLVSVLVLAPSVVPVALGGLAAPAVALLRPLGGLARGNVTRNPRRTASTAGALMIGMALVGAAAVIASSTQASTRSVVENESVADYLLQSATRDVPAAVVDQAAAVDGVAVVDPLRVAGLRADDEDEMVVGVPAAMFGRSLDVLVVDGSLASLADGAIAVQQEAAEDRGWAVGDVVALSSPLGERDVTVGAVVDSSALGVPVVLPEDVFAELVPPTAATLNTVFVVAEEGADLEAVRDGLTDVAAPYVVVSVMDNEEFADQLAGQVNQILVILYALLGLSVVIAVLGIVNTLALSVAERTREIGLLRAVGLGRLQLASVVTIESVLTAVFGTVLGLGVGAGLAATLPTVFADEGLSTLAVPWDQLGVGLGLAVVIGVVAAVWPAVRAARMDVLDAVSYE
ncbi:ABC transporter permease [Actinotalea solisilvae]|uniref:ABC transporter permease n=1 Tax=Actinotalea solisilvae TaxID=2072922 RepID=UPI0018F232F9|nr:FtsX-like permease family protein [Actinotalea solisilvae]